MSIVSFQPQPNFRMGLRFFDDMSMYIVKAVQSPNEKMVDWLLGCKMPARYIFFSGSFACTTSLDLQVCGESGFTITHCQRFYQGQPTSLHFDE